MPQYYQQHQHVGPQDFFLLTPCSHPVKLHFILTSSGIKYFNTGTASKLGRQFSMLKLFYSTNTDFKQQKQLQLKNNNERTTKLHRYIKKDNKTANFMKVNMKMGKSCLPAGVFKIPTALKAAARLYYIFTLLHRHDASHHTLSRAPPPSTFPTSRSQLNPIGW